MMSCGSWLRLRVASGQPVRRFRRFIATLLLPAALLFGQGTVTTLNEAEARKLVKSKVEPEYPAAARQFRIVGDVVVQITVGPDGRVETIDDAKGNQLLKASVVNAVKKWTFNSGPAKMKTSLTFNFKL